MSPKNCDNLRKVTLESNKQSLKPFAALVPWRILRLLFSRRKDGNPAKHDQACHGMNVWKSSWRTTKNQATRCYQYDSGLAHNLPSQFIGLFASSLGSLLLWLLPRCQGVDSYHAYRFFFEALRTLPAIWAVRLGRLGQTSSGLQLLQISKKPSRNSLHQASLTDCTYLCDCFAANVVSSMPCWRQPKSAQKLYRLKCLISCSFGASRRTLLVICPEMQWHPCSITSSVKPTCKL